MNVLIISEFFYPHNIVGAVRPTKIAQKLLARGYAVDVFAKYRVSDSEVSEKKLCTRLWGFADFATSENAAPAQERRHGALYCKLYRIYRNILAVFEAQKTLQYFKEAIHDETDFGKHTYDVVFSSFGPLSSLLCGMYYKKHHPETKWICDFRDPVIGRYIHPLLRPYYRHLEKKACKRADAIVTVSNGYLERICRGKYLEKAYMLPNGYDLEDMVFLKDEASQSNTVTITYVGSLYGGDRDLTTLFQAIRELIDEDSIRRDAICVAYAGTEFDVLKSQAGKQGLEGILQNNGVLSREACLKLQARADMLLLSNWNIKGEYGAFPGKTLEYMLFGKPIVAIITGSLLNGEVTRVIREGDLGIAYEAGNHERDYSLLKQYLMDACNGKLNFQPKQEVLERYNYTNIINKLEEIING